MKSRIAAIFLAIGLVAADTCYVQFVHQYNGGVDGTGDKLRGSVLRGDCPKTVDEPETDNCETLAEFTPVLGENNAIDAGLSNLVASTVYDPNAFDGFMDFEDQHHDFNDDDDACQKSQSTGFAAALDLTVCSFDC